MKYKKGTEGLKESDLRDLWCSVGWVHMDTTYWGKLLNALGNSDVIVAYDEDNHVAGLISSLNDGLNVWISYLAVRKDLHGRGIGTQLISMLIQDMHEECCGEDTSFWVCTTHAKGFYVSRGLTETIDACVLR